jgi:hypothetical protein
MIIFYGVSFCKLVNVTSNLTTLSLQSDKSICSLTNKNRNSYTGQWLNATVKFLACSQCKYSTLGCLSYDAYYYKQNMKGQWSILYLPFEPLFNFMRHPTWPLYIPVFCFSYVRFLILFWCFCNFLHM